MTFYQYILSETNRAIRAALAMFLVTVTLIIVANAVSQYHRISEYMTTTLPRELEARILIDHPLAICQLVRGVSDQFGNTLQFNIHVQVYLDSDALCGTGEIPYLTLGKFDQRLAERGRIVTQVGFDHLIVSLAELVLFSLGLMWASSSVLRYRLRRRIDLPFQELGRLLLDGRQAEQSFEEFEQIGRIVKENQNAKIREEKNRSEQELANLALQVAHDIRSPLTALNMVTGTLGETSESHRQLIRNATDRINAIANALLLRARTGPKSMATSIANSDPQLPGGEDSSRSTAHDVPHSEQNSTEYPGSNRLSSLSDVLRNIYGEKCAQLSNLPELELKLDIATIANDQRPIDVKALLQVLSNLINNAVEACEGKGQVTIALRHGYRQSLIIVISDNGKGMPPSVLERLGYEKISWGKGNNELCGGGAGQGVYFARRLVEQMGGTIRFQSQPAMGTIVSLEFE